MTYLNYLGIYEDAINSSIDKAELLLDTVGLGDSENIDNLHDIAGDILQEIGNFGDITNSIINAYFEAAISIACDKIDENRMDYYINCDDSHIYLDGEEVC